MFVFSVGRLVSRRCHRISIIISAYRFLGVGFRFVNNVATGMDAFVEAEIASGWCDTPLAYRFLGLRFTTLVHLWRQKKKLPPSPLRQRRKTRYGWVVSPYPTGTFTPQEASSFA
jgi:hypothetical protein